MQPSQKPVSQPIDLKKAILVGQLVVTGPMLLIIAGVTAIGYFLFRPYWPIFMIVGSLVSWPWWSVSASRWRTWALRQGCDPHELHEAAIAAGLGWPNGVIFEKTEIKPAFRAGETELESKEAISMPPSEGFSQGEMPDAVTAPAEQPVKGKSFFIRGIAYLIDNFILMVVFFPIELVTVVLIRIVLNIFTKSTGVAFEPQPLSTALIFILMIVLNLVYLTVYIWLAGTTPGKLILKMRVVTESGERVGFKAALIRSVLFLIDSMIFGIIAYFKMKPPLYQRNGDLLAKTIVVGSQDAVIKQGYSKKRFLAASGIVLVSFFLASLLVGIFTIGRVYPLVKTPAAQINLKISDLSGQAKQISDAPNNPAENTDVTDGNLRNFAFRDHMVFSEIEIYNNFLSDTNATLKQNDENLLKKVFRDPQIQIDPAIEYRSDCHGFVLKFSSAAEEIEGYSAFLIKKNVSIRLTVYGEPGSVTIDEVQRLKDVILARIP